MPEFFYRTEDIVPEDVLRYFVETAKDREIIDALKARNPVVLAGSRGVGKSFLLRVAEQELLSAFPSDRLFPVYLTFSRSSLLNTSDPLQFQHWMLARLCARVTRALSRAGLVNSSTFSLLTGSQSRALQSDIRIDQIAAAFEDSWKQATGTVDLTGMPSVEMVRDAIEDICDRLDIARLVILIDEAAHIFLPEQQRQFFTLFRDLRHPRISCKAAVYPGVTSYGDTFQPIHDATMLTLERDILDHQYVDNMREIVEKQSDSKLIEDIAVHGQNFAILAYAATGNPRVLLKTLARAPRVSAQSTNEVLREYYRSDVWSEHSMLPEKYAGHRTLIDWGRRFIEAEVLPDLKRKNDQYLSGDPKQSTCFFWMHRDAPQPVKEALRLLAYTGIVTERATGIRATRSEVGTRYAVNLGCLMALEATPTATLPIARNLTPRRMSEYGANHTAYQSLLDAVPGFTEPQTGELLQRQLQKSIEVLDITEYQMNGLRQLGLTSIGDVLHASETKLQEIAWVGEKRSRRMRNTAMAAIFEYLSG